MGRRKDVFLDVGHAAGKILGCRPGVFVEGPVADEPEPGDGFSFVRERESVAVAQSNNASGHHARSMVRALREPEMSGAYGTVYRDGSGYSVLIVGSW